MQGGRYAEMKRCWSWSARRSSEQASRLEGDDGPHAVAEEGNRLVEQGLEVPGHFTCDGREITDDWLTDPGLTTR